MKLSSILSNNDITVTKARSLSQRKPPLTLIIPWLQALTTIQAEIGLSNFRTVMYITFTLFSFYSLFLRKLYLLYCMLLVSIPEWRINFIMTVSYHFSFVGTNARRIAPCTFLCPSVCCIVVCCKSLHCFCSNISFSFCLFVFMGSFLKQTYRSTD